jgi:hypothetical protein
LTLDLYILSILSIKIAYNLNRAGKREPSSIDKGNYLDISHEVSNA